MRFFRSKKHNKKVKIFRILFFWEPKVGWCEAGGGCAADAFAASESLFCAPKSLAVVRGPFKKYVKVISAYFKPMCASLARFMPPEHQNFSFH